VGYNTVYLVTFSVKYKEKELTNMAESSYYEELLKELEAVQSNEPLMKTFDKKLHNDGDQTNYDSWVDSSLEFLRSHKDLFVSEGGANG